MFSIAHWSIKVGLNLFVLYRIGFFCIILLPVLLTTFPYIFWMSSVPQDFLGQCPSRSSLLHRIYSFSYQILSSCPMLWLGMRSLLPWSMILILSFVLFCFVSGLDSATQVKVEHATFLYILPLKRDYCSSHRAHQNMFTRTRSK